MVLSAADTHDSMVFEELVDGIEPIKGPRGRPRKISEAAARIKVNPRTSVYCVSFSTGNEGTLGAKPSTVRSIIRIQIVCVER